MSNLNTVNDNEVLVLQRVETPKQNTAVPVNDDPRYEAIVTVYKTHGGAWLSIVDDIIFDDLSVHELVDAYSTIAKAKRDVRKNWGVTRWVNTHSNTWLGYRKWAEEESGNPYDALF
jgi:hypothetical protein